MNTVEDRLREALAARAEQSPVAPDAWSKTVARSRHRVFPWSWPAWAVRLAPVAAVVAVAAVVISAVTLSQSIGQGARPAGSTSTKPTASPHPSVSAPPGMATAYRQIPPIAPLVSISLRAGRQLLRDALWFGYVPGHAAAGLALCQFNQSGFYKGGFYCGAAGLPAGTLARSTGTDGTGQIRLGAAAPQVTSVTAVLPNGGTARGVVRTVRGIPEKIWAVSYSVDSAATLVFRDAAGHDVTHLASPGPAATPSRPSHGGIPLFSYDHQTVTAYRLSGDRIGFFEGGSSSLSDLPLSQSTLSLTNLGIDSGPDDLYGYAPTGTARVTLRLADGRQLTSSRIIAGWPGSGVVFWGPVALPAGDALGYDTIITIYNSAGRILREVPLLFIQ